MGPPCQLGPGFTATCPRPRNVLTLPPSHSHRSRRATGVCGSVSSALSAFLCCGHRNNGLTTDCDLWGPWPSRPTGHRLAAAAWPRSGLPDSDVSSDRVPAAPTPNPGLTSSPGVTAPYTARDGEPLRRARGRNCYTLCTRQSRLLLAAWPSGAVPGAPPWMPSLLFLSQTTRQLPLTSCKRVSPAGSPHRPSRASG